MDPHILADKLEITELLYRYARGLDVGDWALWRTVFTDDAYLDYRSAGGIDGDRETVGEFLESSLSIFPVTQHYITNVECEIEGDDAVARAMFYNPMVFPGATSMSFCGGYYHHKLRRTNEGWKSRELIEENAWFVDPPIGLQTGGFQTGGIALGMSDPK
jgi:3-phenylpropionate/cinnamic acid dioxygenase small subunit